LAWIGSPAKRWNTFVANRVGEIQSSLSPSEWHYVKSKDNPADLISQGATPEQLKNSNLWWEGPNWLKIGNNFQEKERSKIEIDGVPEERKRALICLNRIQQPMIRFERFSSLLRLLRVTAYLLRFIYNLKCKREKRKLKHLSAVDLKEARDTLVKLIQAEQWEIGKSKDYETSKRYVSNQS